jgi:hypothetical protein
MIGMPTYSRDKMAAFWEEIWKGKVCRIDQHLFDYYLDILPPAFMGRTVKMIDGTERRCAFGFVEGADRITGFWQSGGSYYAQHTALVSRG